MLRRILRLPVFPLVLAPILLFLPVLIPGRALFWGTPALQFVPWRAWAWETLREGVLPLWNPLLGMGAPLLANYQSALFYPPNWLTFLLAGLGGAPALAWGEGWLVAAHLAWAGLGMAFLARRLGLGRLAQTVGGLSFGLSGYLVARAGFLSINAAVSWTPWVVLGATRLAAGTDRAGRPGDFLLLAASVGMQLLAGHAQTVWFTWLLAGAWLAFLWLGGLAQPGGGSRRWGAPASRQALPGPYLRQMGRAGLRLGAAFGLGVALAAVQLFPTAEYLSQSQRASAVDFEAAMTYSFWPWRLLGLLAPGLFGSPVQGDYWGYGNYWEDAVYIGLLPFLLAVGAVGKAVRESLGRRRSRPAFEAGAPLSDSRPAGVAEGSVGAGLNLPAAIASPAWIFLLSALVLLSFALALGANTPLFPWLYRRVPGFAMFQAPTRFSLLAVFSLSLLAGIGAQGLRRPSGRRLYWTRLGLAAAVAVALGAALAAGTILEGLRASFIRAAATVALWAVLAVLLYLFAPHAAQETDSEAGRARWQWAVVGVVAADLAFAGWGLNPATDAGLYRAPSPQTGAVKVLAGEGRLYLPPQDETELKYGVFFRFDTFRPQDDWSGLRATLLPNLTLLEGLASANNFDPLLPARYARWMEALAGADGSTQRRMLNLMAVSVVERMDDSQPYRVRFEAVETLPRLRWVGCGRTVESGERALEQVLQNAFNAEEEVLLEMPSASHRPVCEGGREGTLRKLSEKPSRLEVQVHSEKPGYLVWADVWYPGWRAWIDGVPSPVRQANSLFRAVEVPAGDHLVVVAYRPGWFFAGAAVSALAWLGLAACAVAWGRARRASTHL